MTSSGQASDWQPRTASGRRLVEVLNDIGRAPYSSVSFPTIEQDIRDIEDEADALADAFLPDLASATPSQIQSAYEAGLRDGASSSRSEPLNVERLARAECLDAHNAATPCSHHRLLAEGHAAEYATLAEESR